MEGSGVIRGSGVTCSVGDAKGFPVCQAGTRLYVPQLVLSPPPVAETFQRVRCYNLNPLLDFVSPAYIQALPFDVCK